MNQLVETRLQNEVTFVVLPPEFAHRGFGGQLRSDRLPPLPKNYYVGMLQTLDKPEPIRNKKKPRKR